MTITGAYSILHALVDMACAVLVMGVSRNGGLSVYYASLVVILYDFFAFALQFPFGMLADRLDRNALVSASGCVLVAVSFTFSGYAFPACIVAGIGNALFHVGGGVDVLNISERKAAPSGIYVSTGAMGLYLGCCWFETQAVRCFVTVALAAGAVLLILLSRKIRKDYNVHNEKCNGRPDWWSLPAGKTFVVYCVLFTVCIRGCFGLIMDFPWKSGFYTGLWAVSAVVLGKAAGGILGDRIGWKKTSVTSLLLAAVLFYPAFDNIICGILALFFFNMTMPITLTMMANLFPKRKGMAFGITSATLFLGAAYVFAGFDRYLFQWPVIIGGTLLSALSLWAGFYCHEKTAAAHGEGQ